MQVVSQFDCGFQAIAWLQSRLLKVDEMALRRLAIPSSKYWGKAVVGFQECDQHHLIFSSNPLEILTNLIKFTIFTYPWTPIPHEKSTIYGSVTLRKMAIEWAT